MGILYEQIRRRGFRRLQEICKEGTEETLHVEFKTLADHSSGDLTRDDRKTLAKALCGLANAEGGTLLIGIQSKNVGGVDTAHVLKPISNIRRVRNRLVSALPDFLSPQLVGITEHVVMDSGDPAGRGYIIVAVPPSDLRPHMSIPDHRYFRRGSQGTRVLEHAEVREMMLAVREAKLTLVHRMRRGISTGDHHYSFNLIFSLLNVGAIPAVAPYIRVERASALSMEGPAGSGFTRRQLPSGGWGVYGSRDVLVHVEDTVDVAYIKTGLRLLRFEIGGSAREVVDKIIEAERLADFKVAPFDLLREQGRPDQIIDISIALGAENVPVQRIDFNLGKLAMLRVMAEQL